MKTKEQIEKIEKKIEELQCEVEKLKDDECLTPIEIAIKNVGKFVYGHTVEHDGMYVKVPLPESNRDWTFAAWDYVRRFCERYKGSYPTHYECNDNSNYQYIKFDDNC